MNNYKKDAIASAFITCIGSTAYYILACATAPKLAKEFTVPDLSEILLRQVTNQKSVVNSRYEFYHRKQGAEESARELEKALRTLANGCKFGEQLPERLRDQYICAIKDPNQLENILQLSNDDFNKLTLEEVIVKMIAKETVRKNHEDSNKPVEIDYVARKINNGDTRRQCSRCGRLHEVRKCPAFNQKCRRCQKKGHFMKMCRSQEFTPEYQPSKAINCTDA